MQVLLGLLEARFPDSPGVQGSCHELFQEMQPNDSSESFSLPQQDYAHYFKFESWI